MVCASTYEDLLDECEEPAPGWTPLDEEFEEHETHRVAEEYDHKRTSREDTNRWRRMRASEFDLYLSKVVDDVPLASSERNFPLHSVSTKKSKRLKSTAEIAAGNAKFILKLDNRGIGRSEQGKTSGVADDPWEPVNLNNASGNTADETARTSVLDTVERECREYRRSIAQQCYRLELSRADVSQPSMFGDLRYQCVPFEQRGPQSSFGQDCFRGSNSARRKERRLRRDLLGSNYAYVAVNLVGGKATQVSKMLNVEEYVTYKDTHSIIDSGAGATVVTEETHLMNQQADPPERFKAFNQTTSTAISKGTAIGRVKTDKGKREPLLLPNSFKIQEVEHDLIAVDGLDQMGYKFVLQGAENSYLQCPNGSKVSLVKRGRLYWLRWEKAVERRRVKPRKHKSGKTSKRHINQSTSSRNDDYEDSVAADEGAMVDDVEVEARSDIDASTSNFKSLSENRRPGQTLLPGSNSSSNFLKTSKNVGLPTEGEVADEVREQPVARRRFRHLYPEGYLDSVEERKKSKAGGNVYLSSDSTNSSANFDIFPTLPEDIDHINQFLNQQELLSSEDIASLDRCDECCHSKNKVSVENGISINPIVCFRMRLPVDDLKLSADADAADNETVGPMEPILKRSKLNNQQGRREATTAHGAREEVSPPKAKNMSLELCHRRWGHWSKDTILKQQRQGDFGNVKFIGSPKTGCHTCKQARATKKNPPSSREEVEEDQVLLPFQQVWSDVKGPVRKDFYGNRYLVTFTCELTRYTCVYFCKTKDEVSMRFRDFNNWVSTLGHKVKLLTSDSGGEYDGGEGRAKSPFNLVCEELGVEQRFTAYYTSGHNGISERINRTFSESTATMLYDAALSHRYWSLAVKHACWLRNRLLHKSLTQAGKSKSPYEALRNRKPKDLLRARVFGCDAWRYRFDRDKSEFSPRGEYGICVGVAHNRKGWLILDPKTQKVKTSFHVSFDEDTNKRRDHLSGIKYKMKESGVKQPELVEFLRNYQQSEVFKDFRYDNDPDFNDADYGSGAGPSVKKAKDQHPLHNEQSRGSSTVDDDDSDSSDSEDDLDESLSSDDEDSSESESDSETMPSDMMTDPVARTEKNAKRALREDTVKSSAKSKQTAARQVRQGHDYPLDKMVRDCIPERRNSFSLTVDDRNWLRFAMEHDWPMKLQQLNPKRSGSGSHGNYENYKSAKTLLQMSELGGTWGDITNDYNKGFIVFDTDSTKTVKEVMEDTALKYQRNESADRRVGLSLLYEDSIRSEFIIAGLDHLESLSHNQQKMLRKALGTQTLESFAVQCANNIMFGDPVTVEEALRGETRQQWIEAMNEEIANLARFDCFKLVPRAEAMKHGKLLKSKWVFKTKYNGDGSVQRYRARLVAKGFLMREGVDYYESFSPVFSQTSLRLVLGLATAKDMRVDQWDLKNAFLQQRIDVDHLYMEPPPGYSQTMPDGVTPAALHCKGSIYGMVQSSRLLHLRLASFLKKHGYKQLVADQCVYVKNRGTYDEEVVCVYVDDIILATKRENNIRRKEFDRILRAEFEMSPWTQGECDWILNMNIKRDWVNGTMHISQTKSVVNLAERFGLDNVQSYFDTPMDTTIKLKKPAVEDIVPASEFDFMSAVGGLLYLTMTTRPDIAYPVGVLSRFMSCPGQDHVRVAKRVIGYLYRTKEYGIRYSRTDQLESQGAPHCHDAPRLYVHCKKSSKAVEGSVEFEERLSSYVDADLAGDSDTMKSTTGFGIMLFGGIIAWSAKLQSTVALSTAEAETNAAVEAVKVLSHIRLLLHELGLEQKHPTTLYEDNNAVMSLVGGGESNKRTRHFLMKFHYLVEKKKSGMFELSKVSTTHQLADVFTKALPKETFKKFRGWMGVIDGEVLTKSQQNDGQAVCDDQ